MKKYTYTEKKDTRSGFGDGLTILGRTNPNVVALCADLIGSLKMQTFINENPDRFFQIGSSGGNSQNIKTDQAWKQNAYVKIRPIRFHPDKSKIIKIFE